MSYAPGTIADLVATFTDAEGDLLDPEALTVDIYDNLAAPVVVGDIPTRLSHGTYQYDYPVPAGADGEWEIFWHATVAGEVVTGSETFLITASNVVVQPGVNVANSFLRSRLAETKEPTDADGSNTLFRDMEIVEILSVSDDLDSATLEGWRRKAARLAHLVDMNESGASRSLSQRYRNAKSMLDHWQKVMDTRSEAAGAALAGRVVGKPMNLREDRSECLQTPFHWTHNWANARPYPTKRLLIPAILG